MPIQLDTVFGWANDLDHAVKWYSRAPRPSDDDLVTPEWVIEHLVQHEAEHRGQIWEARVVAEAFKPFESP